MELYPLSVEYVHVPVTGDLVLDVPVEVAFMGWDRRPTTDTPWHPAEWIGPADTTRTLRVLARGPAAPGPTDAVRLDVGRRTVWVRLTDSPEVIQRSAGAVEVRGA